jgi:hypothetical protein
MNRTHDAYMNTCDADIGEVPGTSNQAHLSGAIYKLPGRMHLFVYLRERMLVTPWSSRGQILLFRVTSGIAEWL